MMIHWMRMALAGIVAGAGLLSSVANATALLPAELAPIAHNEASLQVTGPNGVVVYTPAELETLGTHRLKTATPWRDDPAVFEGVRLVDVLAASGLEAVQMIEVTAENDFHIQIPREVWQSLPILIATRVDGVAHMRRIRGPLQFVMPLEAFSSNQAYPEGLWVWMAAAISAVE